MNPTKINWTTAGLFSLSANDNILINNNISMCVDMQSTQKMADCGYQPVKQKEDIYGREKRQCISKI